MFSVRGSFCAGVVMLAAICTAASATTFTVTNNGDSGAGSLRDTLGLAGVNDTIVFAPGVTGSIAVLTTLTISQAVTIHGPGAANLALSGQPTIRILDVLATGNLTLTGLTLTNGDTAGLGGAIQNAGTLDVRDSVFSANNAGNGGAISNSLGAVLMVDASTFQNNTTTGVGGGGIINWGSAAVSNSAFATNTAPINGGAINTQQSGTTTLINDTFFGNTSGSLGGALSNVGTTSIFDSTLSTNEGSAGGGIATSNNTVTIYNSVFADNLVGAISPDGAGMTTGNNVFFNNGSADDLTGYGTTNFIAATTQPLGALANNGGPTKTMLPLLGRAAICAGSAALLPVGLNRDQRGLPRTAVNDATTCLDAGSVQLSESPNIAVPTLSAWLLCLLAGMLAVFGIRRVGPTARSSAPHESVSAGMRSRTAIHR